MGTWDKKIKLHFYGEDASLKSGLVSIEDVYQIFKERWLKELQLKLVVHNEDNSYEE